MPFQAENKARTRCVPQENGSAGTDRGAAGCTFVIGSQAEGTMVGEFPGLSTLDANENLRVTSDFRGMYCSLLEQWLDFDAAQVIPGASGFARPQLVKAWIKRALLDPRETRRQAHQTSRQA